MIITNKMLFTVVIGAHQCCTAQHIYLCNVEKKNNAIKKVSDNVYCADHSMQFDYQCIFPNIYVACVGIIERF